MIMFCVYLNKYYKIDHFYFNENNYKKKAFTKNFSMFSKKKFKSIVCCYKLSD